MKDWLFIFPYFTQNAYIQPSIDMLIKICTTFHVNADYLLGLEDKRTLDVTGLTNEQIAHLQSIVNDLQSS